MVRDDHDTSSDREHVHGIVQGCFQYTQLVVDGYPQSLKYACERLVEVYRRHCRFNDLAKLRRGFDGFHIRRFAYRARDASAVAFLAPGEKNPGQVLVRGGCDDVGCGHVRLSIHSHVEGTVSAKAEAPLRFVYLMGRHSEIKQNAVNCRDAMMRKKLFQMDHIAMYERHSSVRSEQNQRVLECFGILIEPEDGAGFSKPFQQRAAVTSSTECAVYICAGRVIDEQVDRPIAENRHVISGVVILPTHTSPITLAATASYD